MIIELNDNWKFYNESTIGDGKAARQRDTMCGHLVDLDESDFRTVDVPHDFSIEQPYNTEVGEGCTAYLIGGIGWYRKHFTVPEGTKKVFIEFDGVYNRSNVYCNEQFVKFQAFGYAPFVIDVSDTIKEENVLALKVDRTRHADSRWYAGSGIYRKVKLHVFGENYIPVWGVVVRTTLVEQSYKVALNISLEGEGEVITEIVSPAGEVVATVNGLSPVVTIDNPVLWDIYQPNLYTANIKLIVNDEVVQQTSTTFGLRDFKFDADKGFFINGRNEKIKGVCLHHDCGLVGCAIPKDVWRNRLNTFIEAGVNAIRTAHNPVSADFLDLCDELGLLVQEEFYDEWDNPKDKRFNMNDSQVDYITRGHSEFFQAYAKEDLQNVVRRDINHPCIIQWSIGNEIEWTYPKYPNATGYFSANANGNYFWAQPPLTPEQIRENINKLPEDLYEMGKTAQKLADWTRELDTTRPIIANCILPSASYESGYTDALDIVGFSYRQIMYEKCHKHYPDKPIMGAENVGQWHEWKHVIEKDYISGIFLWTGMDYLGEARKNDKASNKINKANNSGLIDVAGLKRHSYYMFKSLWNEEPSIYMATQTLEDSVYVDETFAEKPRCDWKRRLWRWHEMNYHYNYNEGDMVIVEVYSNCEEVSLYLNHSLISTLRLEDFEDRIYKWCIPYTEGVLTARANNCTYSLASAGSAENVLLVADKTQLDIGFDNVCIIHAQLVDNMGNLVKYEEAEVEFVVTGTNRILGVDNGSSHFMGDHFDSKIETNNGNAILIIGADSEGPIEVYAMCNNNKSNVITIN